MKPSNAQTSIPFHFLFRPRCSLSVYLSVTIPQSSEPPRINTRPVGAHPNADIGFLPCLPHPNSSVTRRDFGDFVLGRRFVAVARWGLGAFEVRILYQLGLDWLIENFFWGGREDFSGLGRG